MTTTAGKKSREALLRAAGKLFAEKGIAQVRLAEIAHAAGVDACMIHYHFGGKDGLIQAVIDEALGKWHTKDITQYYEENHALLQSRDRQVLFISGLVERVYRMLGSDRQSDPGKSMLLQLLQHPHPLRQKILDRHITPGVRVFCQIYRQITGNDDFESAFCWYMFLICPKYLYSACPGMIDLFHPEGKVSASFDQRLQLFTTRQLLSGLGLTK